MGTPTLPPIPARAAAGAALLDQRRPGWHHQVDGDRLDLEDWRADVLGQLYGSFGAGVHKLTGGLSEAEMDAWTVAHGFDVDDVDLGLSAGPGPPTRPSPRPGGAELRRQRRGRPMTRPAHQQLIDLLEQAGTDRAKVRRLLRALAPTQPPARPLDALEELIAEFGPDLAARVVVEAYRGGLGG